MKSSFFLILIFSFFVCIMSAYTEELKGHQKPSSLNLEQLKTLIGQGRLSLEAFKQFIEDNNYDMSKRDSIGFNLLHIVSYYNLTEFAEYLLKKGANPNATDLKQKAPLHLVFEQKNSSKLAKILLENGASPNLKNSYEQSPFHIACEYADPEIIELMIQKGAHIHQTDYRNQTGLHYAARGANLGVVQYLIKKSIDLKIKDNEGYTAFHRAVYYYYRHKTLDTIEHFIKIGDDLESKNKYGYTVLQGIESLNHELLRKNKNDQNLSLRISFLQLAVRNLIHPEKTEIENETNRFNKEISQTESYLSTSEQYVDQIKDLIIKDWSPLHKAVFYSDYTKVESLILEDFDLNVRDKNGWSPLFIAYFVSDLRMANLLLKHGANINLKDTNGSNILFSMTTKHKKIEVLKHLIQNGIQINVSNHSTGNSPLHQAVIVEDPDLVKFFMKHGANMYMKNYSRKTPLDLASNLKDPKIKDFLISQRRPIVRNQVQRAFRAFRFFSRGK